MHVFVDLLLEYAVTLVIQKQNIWCIFLFPEISKRRQQLPTHRLWVGSSSAGSAFPPRRQTANTLRLSAAPEPKPRGEEMGRPSRSPGKSHPCSSSLMCSEEKCQNCLQFHLKKLILRIRHPRCQQSHIDDALQATCGGVHVNSENWLGLSDSSFKHIFFFMQLLNLACRLTSDLHRLTKCFT